MRFYPLLLLSLFGSFQRGNCQTPGWIGEVEGSGKTIMLMLLFGNVLVSDSWDWAYYIVVTVLMDPYITAIITSSLMLAL